MCVIKLSVSKLEALEQQFDEDFGHLDTPSAEVVGVASSSTNEVSQCKH